MEENKKAHIKSTVFKQALNNFERNYNHFLKLPTLENYIEVKIAQKSFDECQKNCISKNQKEMLDIVLKHKYQCFNFKKISKFEEILNLRAEREISATKLINYLQNYEQQAKKLNKKLKYNYSAMLIEYIDKLNEVELNTLANQNFPVQSYIKLPTPSKLKLTDIKKLNDSKLENNFELNK